jgi:microcystin-dependent protein
MSNPFVAEIRIFAGNFAPRGWALCNGQLFPISQNTALFSLLGTTYGGDGRSTFALPNLQGSAPMQEGQGQGLSLRVLGEQSGEQTVTLLQAEMPSHTHSLMGTNQLQTLPDPQDHTLARANANAYLQNPAANQFTQMNLQAIGIIGGNLPHNNMPPILTLTFIIALQGVFPPRP